ncbi:hypothetical protein [Haloquadratum walsbyi]|uniref:N-acetyltransferase domain-containing protein n=1 Tax=Haloquadratum walsbyi J07HQW2 TaxID=1238425 RepID=U1NFR3_9EURY|nr:MAG: hypothetical protein J07HQW2_02385 [Haloquadratum walsbyi J07HQW2]
MDVRDAVESDVETLGAIADLPADALRNVVHDRTVRVAERQRDDAESEMSSGSDTNESETTDNQDRTIEAGSKNGDERIANEGDTIDDDEFTGEKSDVIGFVAFDVRDGTVHVTQLAGEATIAETLLAEPIRFAATEGFDVEFVVPVSEESATTAAEDAGFEAIGRGPRFGDETTTRYRFNAG